MVLFLLTTNWAYLNTHQHNVLNVQLLELFFHFRNDHGKLCLGKNTLLERTRVNLLYCIAKSFGILRKKDDLQHQDITYKQKLIRGWKPLMSFCYKLVPSSLKRLWCSCLVDFYSTANRPFAWWRHFYYYDQNLSGFAFLCKLGVLLFKPRWDY